MRLDGIPLALELAAARVNVLSPEQIAARLDNRFSLLVGGSRAALPRQQTLRALIDWSYDLLSEEECWLLRQLSVFAGGWTLEAAEAVCAGPDVLGSLMQLANKSLVNVVEDRETRYRLLDTIRQYALEKLLEAGEASQARSRHMDYFLQLTETAEPKLLGQEMIAALEQLELEQDNLRNALEWALEHDPLVALRLVGVLYTFWGQSTSMAEGVSWLETALARTEAAFPSESEMEGSYLDARAKALQGEATLIFTLGDNTKARQVVEACISLSRQINATWILASALAVGSTISIFLGDLITARAWLKESISLSRQYDYVHSLGMALGPKLWLAVLDGQPVQPDLLEEALRAARASGNAWAIAMATHNAARLAAASSKTGEALARFEEAAVLFDQMGNQSMHNVNRSEMAHFLRNQGRYPEALAVYRETILFWQEMGHLAAVAHELECIAYIAVAYGQGKRAAKLFGGAEALRESSGSSLTPLERPEYERIVSQLHAQMDAAAVKAAWDQGRTQRMEEAIQYALE